MAPFLSESLALCIPLPQAQLCCLVLLEEQHILSFQLNYKFLNTRKLILTISIPQDLAEHLVPRAQGMFVL